MAIVYKNKEYRNLQEQVLENAKNIAILQEKPGLKPVVVDELPETGEVGILYLVPSEDPETENAYDEYVWVEEEEAFEMVGSTAIDLSGLVTTDTEQEITGAKSFNAITNFNNGLKTSSAEIDGETTMKATAGSASNIWKFRPVNDYNLYVARDGSDRFLFQSNMFAPATYQSTSINLGSANYKWNVIWGNEINFDNNATIHKDSSNRVCITSGGDDKIKVDASEVICKDNFNPDQDGTYSLGRSALRWSTVNAFTLANDYSSLSIKGKTGVNITCDNGSAVRPSTDNQVELGGSSNRWKNIYAADITCPTIVKQPDYSNPDVFESGTLNASGQGTIDMTETGIPSDGLYMFTYGNCQCFLSLTYEMIQNASTYPIRCTCPMMYNGSAYPGILKIERAADLLTLTVATAGVGNVQPSGYGWQLIKVM